MTAIAPPERGGDRPGAVGRPTGLKVSRRDELEAVAFLVGLLGILLVVVVTIGSASPFGP